MFGTFIELIDNDKESLLSTKEGEPGESKKDNGDGNNDKQNLTIFTFSAQNAKQSFERILTINETLLI